jgi:hypothetical protein
LLPLNAAGTQVVFLVVWAAMLRDSAQRKRLHV